MESSSPLSEHYLSDILVALFDVFCGAHNQLMNTVYLCILLQQWDGRLRALGTKKTCAFSDSLKQKTTHLLQDFLSKNLLESRDLHHLPLDLPAACEGNAWKLWVNLFRRSINKTVEGQVSFSHEDDFVWNKCAVISFGYHSNFPRTSHICMNPLKCWHFSSNYVHFLGFTQRYTLTRVPGFFFLHSIAM